MGGGVGAADLKVPLSGVAAATRAGETGEITPSETLIDDQVGPEVSPRGNAPSLACSWNGRLTELEKLHVGLSWAHLLNSSITSPEAGRR